MAPAPSPSPGSLPHAPGPPWSLGPALIPSPQQRPPENGGLLPGPDRIPAPSVPRGTGATPQKLGGCSWPRYLHCLRWEHGSPAEAEGLLVSPSPAPSVPGGRRHPTKVGGCSRTHCLQCLSPEEGGTALKGGAARVHAHPAGTPAYPRPSGLHSRGRNPAAVPRSGRPSPRPGVRRRDALWPRPRRGSSTPTS